MQNEKLKYAAAAGFALACALALSPAGAADVALDNIAVKQAKDDVKVVIKHVDVKGSSLSADDVKKLLSGELADADAKALALKFKADSLTIPELTSTSPKGVATMHNLVATGIDAGKIAKLDLAGADIAAPDGGGHAGALHAETIDIAPLLTAAESGKAPGTMGITLFTFEGLDLKVPDEKVSKDAPGGNMIHITVAPVAFAASYDGAFPVKGEVTMKGMTIELAPGSKEATQIKAFGLDKIQIDGHAASTCDKAAKTCHLIDSTLNFAGLGSIVLSGNFANMPTDAMPSDKDAMMATLMQEQIADISLKIVNTGLFDKAIAAYAASSKMNPAMAKASLPMMAAMAPQFIPDPVAGKKVGDALGAFLKDPKSLMVSLKSKGAPIAIGDLASKPDPAALLQKMTLDAAANQ